MEINMSCRFFGILAILVITASALPAQEIEARVRRGFAVASMRGSQNLPYSTNDNDGNQWFLQQGGWLQSRGNMPLYSQGAMLMINGNQPNVQNNQARWDEKTGELLLENMKAGQINVTRRIYFNKDESYVRYVDVLKNAQPQEQKVQFQIQTSTNYGINGAQMIADPKKPDVPLGWSAQT